MSNTTMDNIFTTTTTTTTTTTITTNNNTNTNTATTHNTHGQPSLKFAALSGRTARRGEGSRKRLAHKLINCLSNVRYFKVFKTCFHIAKHVLMYFT